MGQTQSTIKPQYLSLLPVELITLIFLYFRSWELADQLYYWKEIEEIHILFQSAELQRSLWKHKFPSIKFPGDISGKEYIRTLSKQLREKAETIRQLAKNGNLIYLLSVLVDKEDYNLAMGMAAFAGKKEVVERMMLLGADNYNWSMNYAAEGGYMDIVDRMLQLGADSYEIAERRAAECGKKYIEFKMRQLINTRDFYNNINNENISYNDILETAIFTGAKDVIKKLLHYAIQNKIEIDYDSTITKAKNNIPEEIIHLFKLCQSRSKS